MIIFLLFAGAVLFACSMIFMQHTGWRAVWITVGLVVTVGSVLLMCLNYNQHLGMKRVTTRMTYPLTSSVTGKHILLFKPVGTKTERIYLYNTNPLQSKLEKTTPATTTVIVRHHAKTASMHIDTTHWVYKNEELRLMFAVGMGDHTFIGKHITFELPANWRVVPVTTAAR
ncbi:hypothetical protein AYR62_09930 [Secundilactobacillus paracollinoides]|uniref:DUF4811 domain-containing protein n=1 Tax=Secundilactobacillus paracollinoides TaxID=240427 RepID=UPI0006D1C53F|nr:DUF4811 domain-containing protein [Secundilactobacillus paracollinoides]ANZ64364.1 hypothetical protein AYR62_09930 [Secundilactobacillus paracollinoides]KRL76167.1 hypothetical protein FC17_GL002219 [Secundilactobacillus paracollinoides DSM 15502 = JCM 11969]